MPQAWLPTMADDPERLELLTRCICRAADLSRSPLKHALVPQEQSGDSWILRLEARDPEGHRCPSHDLELEIYGSAADPSLQLAWASDETLPMLWQGRHPVWMDGTTGVSCTRPDNGLALETLARRLRAELIENGS